MQKQLPPIETVAPACPYCGVIQEPPPKQRRRCRDCGETIFVRSDRRKRLRYLLTERQAFDWDYEATDRYWRQTTGRLAYAYKSQDWEGVKDFEDELARLMFERERDSFPRLRSARAAELRHLQQLQADDNYPDFDRVRVVVRGDESCKHCRRHDGDEYHVSTLRAHPILPVEECEGHYFRGVQQPFCHCHYEPVLPEGVEWPKGFDPDDQNDVWIDVPVTITKDGQLEVGEGATTLRPKDPDSLYISTTRMTMHLQPPETSSHGDAARGVIYLVIAVLILVLLVGACVAWVM